MSIIGTHALFYTSQADALRAMMRDLFGLKHVDAGGGWLIFTLPPAELGIHPIESGMEKSDAQHKVSFMCDDIQAFVARMKAHGIDCDPVKDAGWGLLTHLTLPGGGKIGVYQPRHPRPPLSR